MAVLGAAADPLAVADQQVTKLAAEFNSFSMRSAMFGHGTNSKFILMPDCASKSLLSSTSAFAGSHAAQHSVSSLSCAEGRARSQECG